MSETRSQGAAERQGQALLGPVLFLAVAASFLGSLLLFAFEPYVGKLLLPSFGGTPLLWNTCMVFYQVALLAGYLYAMLLARIASVRTQLAIHLAVMATLFVAYPGHVGAIADVTASPLRLLVGWLSANALLPFLGLAALTTLVQSWFARSGHPHAEHPYRLYAASNAGSMVGLFAYPLLFEPALSLGDQRRVFLALLAVLVAVVAAFGWLASRARGSRDATAGDSSARSDAGGRHGRNSVADPDFPVWKIVGLTAVPSSLLLGVTNYILTDIASIPFFWTVPLAIYLATFIVAFGRSLYPLPEPLARLSSLLLLVVVATLCAEANSPAEYLIPLHLVVFFLACLFCHVRVTSLQPPPDRLPQYYLAISVGGAVGGMLTLLVPPLVTDGLVEYPLALVAASLAIVRDEAQPDAEGRTLGAAATAIDLAVPAALVVGSTWLLARVAPASGLGAAIPFLPAAFWTLSANTKGPRFAVRLAAVVLASLVVPSPFGQAIYADRNFFGRVRVTVDPSGRFHRVVHGSTIHGMQEIDGMDGCRPASYYHPTGPAGRFLATFEAPRTPMHVALVGLGSGALACYARPGDVWDLYELNPAMAEVASDPRLFTFVTNSKAGRKEIVLGDARIELARRDAVYDLIVVDAFSSDAIPLHLVTREAIATYAGHLTPEGVLLFHISNRFFRLQPVLARVGETAGLSGWAFEDLALDEESELDGKSASTWMILAREQQGARLSPEWKRIAPDASRIWTDEYSNPLGAMQWSSATASH